MARKPSSNVLRKLLCMCYGADELHVCVCVCVCVLICDVYNYCVYLGVQHVAMQAFGEEVRHVRSPVAVVHAEERVHTALLQHRAGTR